MIIGLFLWQLHYIPFMILLKMYYSCFIYTERWFVLELASCVCFYYQFSWMSSSSSSWLRRHVMSQPPRPDLTYHPPTPTCTQLFTNKFLFDMCVCVTILLAIQIHCHRLLHRCIHSTIKLFNGIFMTYTQKDIKISTLSTANPILQNVLVGNQV